MSKEAMKLALEAYLCREMPAGTIIGDPKWWVPKIAMVIREALAEQPAQQEPVAWMYPDDYERMTTSETFCTVYSVEVGSATRGESTVALYTPPPAQRTWVGLTNNELQPMADEYRILFGSWVEDFARAIEAKLKEKNT